MTPDELMARCRRFADDNFTAYFYDMAMVEALESLCREMIAEGLEGAAVEFECKILGYCRDPNDFMDWCRQEAQRVKEDVWITEKAAQEDGCRVDAGRIEECQRELGS